MNGTVGQPKIPTACNPIKYTVKRWKSSFGIYNRSEALPTFSSRAFKGHAGFACYRLPIYIGPGGPSLFPKFLLAFGIERALHHAQNCGPNKAHGSNEWNPVMHRHHSKVHDLTRHPNHPQLFHGFSELRGVLTPDPFPVSALHGSFDAVKDWEVDERMVDSLVQKHLCGDRHSVSISGFQWRTQSVEQLVVKPVLTEA
mmetsp:Transcript_3130/g.11146  ORF Transcript_3130/g.11146 Transcript_3130/m.11146 type:complete len:199 (-) Transcript_3130:415-1011(-)